jgi:hypothetical protein
MKLSLKRTVELETEMKPFPFISLFEAECKVLCWNTGSLSNQNGPNSVFADVPVTEEL